MNRSAFPPVQRHRGPERVRDPGRAWLAGLFLAALLPAPGTHAMQWRGAEVLEHEGVRYVSLRHIAHLNGGALDRSASSRAIATPEGRFICRQGTRRAETGGICAWLHYEPLRLRGRWAIAEADAETLVGPVLRPERHLARAGTGLVVLDPGHGGEDQGARSGAGLLEKTLTLDLAGRVQRRLAARDCRAVLTRETDLYLALDDRSDSALRRRADVFVSIHFNQAANTSASGIETFILSAPGAPSTLDDPSKPAPVTTYRGHAHQGASALLGLHLQTALVQGIAAEDRGLRRARFAVLRNAPCPAALVECGFLSHPAEAAAAATEERMEALADALTAGILAYLEQAGRAASGRLPGP